LRDFASAALLLATLGGCATRPTASPASISPATRAAIADFTRTSGVPQEEITVVSETDATWNDGCLGCPRKGEMCAQVITSGSRVVLLARGETHEYHADRSGSVRRCP
jgi:hypothetical protein